jgi:NitT/TauT family transport system permease protein
MRYIAQQLINYFAPFGLILGIWITVNHFSSINPELLPTPLEVGFALYDLFVAKNILIDILWSIYRVVFGMICGGILGIMFGTVTGRLSVFNWLLSPIFNAFRSLPPVAIVPLVVVWAGLGEPAKIFITSWAAFFPIWLNTHEGVSSVDKMIIWVARSLGAQRRRLLFKVTLLAALPQILVGFRLAISSTLICVIVAEMTGAYAGLGYRLNTFYLVFRVDYMLACMVILALLGVAVDRLFAVLSLRIFPWIKVDAYCYATHQMLGACHFGKVFFQNKGWIFCT